LAPSLTFFIVKIFFIIIDIYIEKYNILKNFRKGEIFMRKRERWGTKLGIILAVAGSAVGIGNFLRFPGKVALNGGGAFMIPYFISFLILGIPLSWVEWSLGRYGGQFSHGSAPGIFHSIWKNKIAKYLGVIGLFGPLVIFFYYVYIESWSLGYAFFSITGKLLKNSNPESMKKFLENFQLNPLNGAYYFFLITFILNFYILYRGISKGIEKICEIGMPILAILGILLVVRVFTLRSGERTVVDGLNFLWMPDFKAILEPKVWLEAAGQIFFTLSVGIGVILTYASYLDRKSDIALSALSSSATNEFFEVIIGGSFVIPAAFIFFGEQTKSIAEGGIFNLGFVTMPLVFQKIPLGSLISFLWFVLLFIAGFTSSISILQPAISFFEDEFKFSKSKSVLITALICFIFSQPAIFFIDKGVVDELDFWGGTLALVIFALIEVIIFAWILDIEESWKELHIGADIKIPEFFKFIIKYVTPIYLIIILLYWVIKNGIPLLILKGVSKENLTYILGIRVALFLFFILLIFMVRYIWKKRGEVL